jgi:hypothetical protein
MAALLTTENPESHLEFSRVRGTFQVAVWGKVAYDDAEMTGRNEADQEQDAHQALGALLRQYRKRGGVDPGGAGRAGRLRAKRLHH